MSRLLVDVGEALYGSRWQSELARDLECNVRTMQRWAGGAYEVPDGIWLDLLRITQERAFALDNLADRLKVEGAPGNKRP